MSTVEREARFACEGRETVTRIEENKILFAAETLKRADRQNIAVAERHYLQTVHPDLVIDWIQEYRGICETAAYFAWQTLRQRAVQDSASFTGFNEIT